jgi:hypothetical protein
MSRTATSKDETAEETMHLKEDGPEDGRNRPTHSEIAARAYELWLEQGEPAGSAEENWLEAERQLRTASTSHSMMAAANQRGGSVQV